MFDKTLTESSRQPRSRKGARTLLVSLVAHSATLLVLLSLPLIYYQSLPSGELLTFLSATPLPRVEAPPPPPSPPPARPPRQDAGPRVLQAGVFQAPLETPHGIPEPPDEIQGSVVDDPGFGKGVPLGVPGVPPGGFPGSNQIGATGAAPPPPPPPPVRREPVRVSQLQNSKLIRRVEPVYPRLAVVARIEGMVVLQATINELGEVIEVQVVRGKPLLTEAAIEAVKQWRYSPTILNGEPVSVITTITVTFQLQR